MKQKSDSQQWDDQLEQAFGTERADDPGFTPPVQSISQNTTQASPPTKRSLYCRLRFWVILVALAILLGVTAWLLTEKSHPEQPISPEEVAMQEGLELCKNTLAQWQMQESYHMQLHYLYYGDTLGGPAVVDSWRSGDDFLYTADFPNVNGGMVVGYLKQDGILYTASAGNNGDDGVTYSYGWEACDPEELQESHLLSWPITFDWDASEIKGFSISGSSGHFSSVSFAVLQGSNNFDSAGPYHVHFTFDSSQRLDSVTVILTFPGNGSQTHSTVITYRMGSERTSEIKMKVDNAFQTPLTPPEYNIAIPA